MTNDSTKDRNAKAGSIASLENAYRVATRVADAENQDMQVLATGKPERPFIAERADQNRKGVVARIVADQGCLSSHPPDKDIHHG